MENFDPAMETRVWQRVLGEPSNQPGSEDLRPLILAAAEAASAYRQLAKASSGKNRDTLWTLYEGEMANIACLKGIQILNGGSVAKVALLAAPNAHLSKALEKSYHRARRALAEYAARSADPEFGPVFGRMAEREKAHCALVAELLGGNMGSIPVR